ncbi:putative glycosyltransferase [Lactococcus cremoris subsp. cremoris UC509.9]|uniref:Glycosyltransferase n=1 Tax=Lactococcus lactis subsp. cremoris TaxID=1359 RepID=A0AAJ6MFS9_LACLC|nr:glycosyltransferase family 2 protein [Lactococcus cremoris]AFW90901.1 putative glycosyltransferase [Lactococcus cremoris subsp. cremoris UC509.9]ARD90540.1 glycosyltransferase [Lactococcus cremoris]MRM68850.1 glycosyltransferase [Lactococcus cremoris]QJD19215.1 glycosyltransferase [Lactococcus cremoris]QRZ29037.1 glycosyltransferase [Lactococcus cremoris]
MTNKLVTIILPVYNGEKYLKRAIDSVLNQTIGYDKLTLLVINDGGTDSSSQIISNYQKKYPELIHFIDRENKGVAKTRNEAIILTETEYLTFLDQDDYLDQEFVQKLYQEAKTSKVDVVVGGYRRPDEVGSVRKTVQPSDTEFGKFITMAAWSKLHRTKFLKENKIEFFDNSVGEDNVFTFKEIMSTQNILIINYIGYNWFYNTSSVSNTAQSSLNSENQEALERLLEKLFQVNDNSNSKINEYFIVRMIVFYLLFSGRNSTLSEFASAELKFNSIMKNYGSSYNILTYIPKGESFSIKMILKIFYILKKMSLLNFVMRFYCKGK